MAKSGGLLIPPELKRLYNDLMRRLAPRSTGSVGLKSRIPTRKAQRDVALRSLLPECSELWAGLSESQKQAWSDAGAESLYSGWQLFVQDTSYRLKFGLEGLATPSVLHQYKAGHIAVEAPANKCVLLQEHPQRYFVARKVTGSKGLYEDVPIDEQLALPLEVGISYRDNLESAGANPYARFFARVESHYQGQKIFTDVGVDCDLASDWQRETSSLSTVLGVVRAYNLFIDLNDVRGWFEFDNVLAFHSGSNYARDFRCTNIAQPFSQTHFMVAPSWGAFDVPTGAEFDSIYPAD